MKAQTMNLLSGISLAWSVTVIPLALLLVVLQKSSMADLVVWMQREILREYLDEELFTLLNK